MHTYHVNTVAISEIKPNTTINAIILVWDVELLPDEVRISPFARTPAVAVATSLSLNVVVAVE